MLIGHRNLMLMGLLLVIANQLQAQSPVLESSGDVLLFAMPAVALGGSIAAKDYRGTWQFSKGFLLNQGLTIILKRALNKPRPFDNGDNAFPSGHTSTTFQSAAFIQRRYGWKYGIPAYVLASYTGYTRINAQRHDGWDILGGMLVGVGSAYLFTTPFQEEHLELAFASEKGYYSIGIKYTF